MKKWDTKEINYLIDNWGKVDLEGILNYLNRSKDSVIKKALRLDLDIKKSRDMQVKKRWTKEEDKIILKYYHKVTVSKIATLLPGRTENGIIKRADVLGLSKDYKIWTREDERYLKEKWGHVNINTLTRNLKRSKNAIFLKANSLGLSSQALANGEYLIPTEISNILGVPTRTIYGWLESNKLKYKIFKANTSKRYQISIDFLCEFLEEYQECWSTLKADMTFIKSFFSGFMITERENFSIKDLPNWLINKISKDYAKTDKSGDWTTGEVLSLLDYKIRENYSYREMSVTLNRSISSIKSKLHSVRSKYHLSYKR